MDPALGRKVKLIRVRPVGRDDTEGSQPQRVEFSRRSTELARGYKDKVTDREGGRATRLVSMETLVFTSHLQSTAYLGAHGVEEALSVLNTWEHRRRQQRGRRAVRDEANVGLEWSEAEEECHVELNAN